MTSDITAPYNTVDYLINEVLSNGDLQISNVTLTQGDLPQIGYFSDANTANPFIGYSSGVVMSTGGAMWATDAASFPIGGSADNAMDPNLQDALDDYNISGSQNNAVIIEFDFVPSTDYIEFFYTFASKEYPTFTCSSYNDVFGFFISGPNPADPTDPFDGFNIARIPTDLNQTAFTNIPVMINSINSGAPVNDPDCLNINPNYMNDNIFFLANNPQSPNGPNFPGLTIPLRAYTSVVCEETYHIKLAICDVSDGALNSAVFLQENSLSSPVDVSFEASPNVYPDTNGYFYEGCGTSTITFKRPEIAAFAPGTGDLTVDFSLSGQAQFGSDYVFLNNPWNDHLVIPNNASEFVLEIQPLDDGIIEGLEDLVIKVPHISGQSCSTEGYVEFELKINDYPEITVELVDEINSYCPGDEVQFEVFVNGGLPYAQAPEYLVHWSQIGYSMQQTVYPEESTTYVVEIEDLCPQYKHIDSVRVNVNIWPELELDDLEDQYPCDASPRQYVLLDGKITGGDAIYTYEWIDVNTNDVVSTDRDPTLIPGEYIARITDGCEEIDEEAVTIFDYEIPNLEIVGEENGTERSMFFNLLEFPVNANYPSMSIVYEWDFGDGSPVVVGLGPITHQFPEFGNYTVSLRATNEKGCTKTETKLIEVSPMIGIPTIFTPNGDGQNEGFKVVSSRQYESFEMRVYDRWGKELFVSNDIDKRWFGTTKSGDLCVTGTYVYKVSIKYPNYKDTKHLQGFINLMR
ncbi:MAG: choice-of-anchor L domain-containing protein [Flavobacteriales bacterium]